MRTPTLTLSLQAWRQLLLAGCLALSSAAWADADHDRARQALQSGLIRPLSDILQSVSQEHPGQVLEVELEHKREQWFYEIKLLSTSGTLRRLRVDATSGQVLPRSR
jgi:uncharacterized membrane protein YkoI